MGAFFKRLYLFYFQFKYFIFSIFIRQNNNTILFIQEFEYTLDHIQKRHSSSLYTKINIYKKEKMNSKIKKMIKAKYIYIDNYNVLLGYIPKKYKSIFQVWHGAMAIKTIGFSDYHLSEINEKDRKRYQRVYDSVDYYICPSEHMKEVFIKSFNQPESKMILLGYTKLDYYLDSSYSERVEQIQIQNEYLLDRLNILYIPTFRDEEEANLEQINFINTLYNDFQDKYNILYKIHPKVKLKDASINGKEILSEELECMIEIADIIITDYSSVVIEALLQNKALIYYLYDLDEYKQNRGLNIEIDELPGIKTYNYEQLKAVIENKKYKPNSLEQLDEKYVPINLKNEKSMITAKVIKETLKL